MACRFDHFGSGRIIKADPTYRKAGSQVGVSPLSNGQNLAVQRVRLKG